MRKEDKKKLTINRRIIVNHLTDLEGVLDYLISKQIFTPPIRERIIYENKVPSDQVRQTLDILITKNALSYQYFLEALILTDNTDIAAILEPEYQSSEACRLMIERERIVMPSTVSNPLFLNNSNNNNSNTPQQVGICRRCSPIESASNIISPGSGCGSPFQSMRQFPLTPTQIRQNNRQLQLSMHYQQFQSQQSNHFYPHPQQLNVFPSTILNSRSNTNFSSSSENSRSSSKGQSMSPLMTRARSSSVTGFYNLGKSNSKTRNRSGASSIDEDCGYPITVSSYDDNDQTSPALMANTELLPATYNIEWSDVNSLELDFVVYRTVPNIRKQLSPNECYHMESKPRGLCLIINNEHFYDENGKERTELRRYGTDMDASRLKNLYEKLNFKVEMYVDLTEREMRHRISWFADECDTNSLVYDAICLILLSHGTDGYVYGVDFENRINMDKDILSLFDDVLIGKPKLFIFQACRGEHLNQKDSVQNPISFIPQSISTSSFTVSNLQSSDSKPPLGRIKPATSCSSVDEETIKKFKDLKVSSQQSGSLEMMYKKKTKVNGSINTSSGSSSSISSLSGTKNKSKIKTRSRSHSRSKYQAYLATAATAIKTVCQTSPSSSKTMLSSISTQTTSQSTHSSQSLSSSNDEDATIANCYQNTNIITSTNCSQSLMNFIDGRPIKTCLPSRSDFFIWYSSARGFVSHRDADGSPFIKCLVTVFSRCAYELELIEMVRKVNLLMQQYEKHHFDERNAVASYFMVPVAEFHLAKRLYFNP